MRISKLFTQSRHLILSALLCSCLQALSQEVLFQSDFASASGLDGWCDVHQHMPPAPKLASIAAKDGKTVLEMGASLFGISHPLKHPVIIDDRLSRITMTATMLKPFKHRGRPMGMALSSRKTVAQDAGQAFWRCRDSGFLVKGYAYSLQPENLLSYQVEGRQVQAHPTRPPFNLLQANDRWTTWKLVYDHTKRTLAFFNHTSATQPAITIYQVKLDGVALNSLWLNAWGTLYQDVNVTVDYK